MNSSNWVVDGWIEIWRLPKIAWVMIADAMEEPEIDIIGDAGSMVGEGNVLY